MNKIDKSGESNKKEDKIVNYTCNCNKFFKSDEKILYILPCCHIIHEKCLNDYLLKSQYNELNTKSNNKHSNNYIVKCPNCKMPIKKILTEKVIMRKKKYKQESIDIKSIRLPNNGTINYMLLPINIIKLNSWVNKLIIASSTTDILNVGDLFFKSFNIKINIIDNTKNNPIKIVNNKITWLNKDDEKMVIISNHSHEVDTFILYYILRCGFIAGENIKSTDIGKLIAEKCDLLLFKRGVDVNVVDKIKEYIQKKKKIVIFPEGTIGNNETLLRFRTGAFHVGEPICPIIIKWKNYIYDDDFKTFALKLITQDEILVDVYVNDIFYPPFSAEKIEYIRNYMAKIGNFQKSRVSNRSIKE